MTHLEEIGSSLHKSMSSWDWYCFTDAVKDGEKESALATMRQKGLSDADAESLYARYAKLWAGEDVVYTEIPVADMADTIARMKAECEATGADEPQCLVRFGHEVAQARLFPRHDDGGEVFVTNCGPVKVVRVKQFWLITTRASAAPRG